MNYFYTDPLAAAWMAKHFDMGFEGYNHYGDWAIVIEAHRLGKKEKFYIHPDSLHLLEPKDDDVVIVDYTGYDAVQFFDEEERSNRIFKRIIQRNGIAFIWPESEK